MDRSPEKKQKDRRNTARLLTMITQFGLNMLVPVFMCFFAGRYLDKHFGTAWITVVLFFVGALAGFTNVFKMAGKFYGGEAPLISKPPADSSPKKGEAVETDKDSYENKMG